MNIDALTVDECEERTLNTDIPLLRASSFTHGIPIEHVDANIERCTVHKSVTVDIPVKQVSNSFDFAECVFMNGILRQKLRMNIFEFLNRQ